MQRRLGQRTEWFSYLTILLHVAALLGMALLAGCTTPTAPDRSELQPYLGANASEAIVDGYPRDDPDRPLTEQGLRDIIIAASGGLGLDYFKLPDSMDFPSIPQDPMNPINGFSMTTGMYLFVEPGLAEDNVRPEGFHTYSCGSCHPTHSSFYSSLPQGLGEGGSGFGTAGEGRVRLSQYDSSPDTPDVAPVRPPSIINMAYQEVVMWDGKLGGVGVNLGTEPLWLPGTPMESNLLGMHGLETQAHAGLKLHRMGGVDTSLVASNAQYQLFFQMAFPEDPTINLLNAAKAIAAFERTVLTNQAPFQLWLSGQSDAMTAREKLGAAIFFGKGGCVTCHTGPALNSMTFHALGMNDLDNSVDPARVDLAPFGGVIPTEFQLGRGGFTQEPADEYKFKTPQLYNMKDSHFYGHGSTFASIRDVVEYINDGVPQNGSVPQGQLAAEFHPLGLTGKEINALVAFLEDGLYDPNMMRYLSTFIPTALCYPNNDPQSQIDLGCGGALLTQQPINLRRPALLGYTN